MSYNFMKFMPCNECCECTRFVDEFDCRENLTDGEWEILSGSWNLVRADPDEHYGFIRWTWGVEAQCETPEGDDELTVTKWVRTESHRYGATVVGTFNPFHIVADFWTGFGFSVGDQVDVRFAALCGYADWCRYVVTAIDDYRVALYDPTESNAYPNPNDDYVLTSRGSCLWDYTVDDATIAANVILSGSEYKIRVTLSGYASAFGGQFAVNDVWEKSYGETPPNCCSVSGDVLNWVSSSGDYDSSGSTCTLTASGSCNQYCQHCAGETPNAPYYFNVGISGMVPYKAVTVRQVLAKLGTIGAWDDPFVIVHLYEGHGLVVGDWIPIFPGVVASVATASVVIERLEGGEPPFGDPVTVTPSTAHSPCGEIRKPSEDGSHIGQVIVVAAWPDNRLEGSGRIQVTREIEEDIFHLRADTLDARKEETENILRLHFGGDYYFQWNLCPNWMFSPPGVLTKYVTFHEGVVTFDHEHIFKKGNFVTLYWDGGSFKGMQVFSITPTTITVFKYAGDYPPPGLPPVDTVLTSVQLTWGYGSDLLQLYGPGGPIGLPELVQSTGSVIACIGKNAEGQLVANTTHAYGRERGKLLGISSFPNEGFGFGSTDAVQLSRFTIAKRQEECPECNKECVFCIQGTESTRLKIVASGFTGGFEGGYGEVYWNSEVRNGTHYLMRTGGWDSVCQWSGDQGCGGNFTVSLWLINGDVHMKAIGEFVNLGPPPIDCRTLAGTFSSDEGTVVVSAEDGHEYQGGEYGWAICDDCKYFTDYSRGTFLVTVSGTTGHDAAYVLETDCVKQGWLRPVKDRCRSLWGNPYNDFWFTTRLGATPGTAVLWTGRMFYGGQSNPSWEKTITTAVSCDPLDETLDYTGADPNYIGSTARVQSL